jgi:hypothetical protein
MHGQILDFFLRGGADLSFELQYIEDGAPVDITGWSAKSEIRHRRTNELLAVASIAIPTPTIGTLVWFMSGAATVHLDGQIAVWDVVLVAPDGSPTRPWRGAVTILPAITDLADGTEPIPNPAIIANYIKGDKGDRGDKGEPGSAVYKGDQGIQGIQGIKGDKGDQGIQGEKGYNGDQGPQGIQGTQGIQGIQGEKGDQGSQGDKGDIGPFPFNFRGNWSGGEWYQLLDAVTFEGALYYLPNTAGWTIGGPPPAYGWTLLVDRGSQGVQGPQGFQGEKGDKGNQGDQGIQGTQGSQGDKGDKGDKGDQGEPGSAVYKGDQGIQGIQGIQGSQGDKGDKGDKGDQGPQGDKGDKGDQGDQGIQGTQGNSIYVFRGQWDANSVYFPNEGVHYNGSLFICIFQVGGASPDSSPYWSLFVSKGDKGDQGDQGTRGIQGEKGDQGIQGIQGEKGDQGDPATAYSGTEWFADRTYREGDIVTISGSESAYVSQQYNNAGHAPAADDGYWWQFLHADAVTLRNRGLTVDVPVAGNYLQFDGASWTPAAITVESLGAVTSAQAQALVSAEIATVSVESIGAIGTSALSYLATTGQVAALTPASIGAQPVGDYAPLVSGLVPSANLPSYVDDVLEFGNLAALPLPGETGKIYVTTETNKIYRWSGSAYIEIQGSPGSSDAVAEGVGNLYFTNARAQAAVSSQLSGLLNSQQANALVTAGIAAITPQSIGALSTSQSGSFIATLQQGSFATTASVAAITPSSIGAFATSQIIGISNGGTGATTAPLALTALGAASATNLAAVSSAVLGITPASIGAIPTSQAGSFATTAQLAAITPTTIGAMATTERASYISTAQIGAYISTAQIGSYATTASVAAITPASIGAMATSERSAYISTAQIGSYATTASVAAITPASIGAIATTQQGSFATTAQISAFITSAQLPAATTASLGAIKVGSNLTILPDGTLSATGGGVTTFSGGTTGLTPSTATAGAITLAGTLAVANGGTGATSASVALTNLGAQAALTTAAPLAISIGGTGAITSIAALSALGAAPITPLTSAQSGSYTLALGDANSTLSVTASTASNITVPLNSAVAFPVGTQIIVRQQGTGQLTFVPTGGVTFEANALTYTTSNRYAVVALIKTGTDTWALGGDLTPNPLTIAQGGTNATDAHSALYNLGSPFHYATVRASTNQAPSTLTGPYTGTWTGSTLTLTVGDTSLLAAGMCFATTGLTGVSIVSILNSTQVSLSSSTTTQATPTSLTIYNNTATQFTLGVTGVYTLELHPIAVGDIVNFTAQTSSVMLGPWVCIVAGATGVAPVFQRPSWFTGTTNSVALLILRGNVSQGFISVISPAAAADADIVVGSTNLAALTAYSRAANAVIGSNTFTAKQTFAANTSSVSPYGFSSSTSQPLNTSATAGNVEFDGTYAYLTPATTVARRPFADGAIFHITLLQTAAMTVATPTATTLTFAVGVQATIDGHTLALYDTVLLTAQATASQNGPWIVTTVGTASVAAIWTRPNWFQGSAIRGNMTFGITRGTAGQGTTRYLFPATLGDTDITAGTTSLTTATNGIFLTAVPATATSAGVVGQMAADSAFFYACHAANTWKRAALTTF